MSQPLEKQSQAYIVLRHGDHPEDSAMMQSLYSRSPDSIDKHIAKVEAAGSGHFMEQFYINYGHQSIADSAFVTLYIEGVSMAVAKAIQDNPLYNGQEASTRYIKFGELHHPPSFIPFAEIPSLHALSAKILDDLFALYRETLALTEEGLARLYPMEGNAEVKAGVWRRAIGARATDICRALLPIGTKTNLSWTTNLRQAKDNIERMWGHSLKEVRNVASDMAHVLCQQFPNSFPAYERWFTTQVNEIECFQDATDVEDLGVSQYLLFNSKQSAVGINVEQYNKREANILIDRCSSHRTPKTMLPRMFLKCGVLHFTFELDYSSFRDMQRHRNGYIPIPKPKYRDTLAPWYWSHLQEALGERFAPFEVEFKNIMSRIKSIYDEHGEDVQASMLLPMGLLQWCSITCGLPQSVYIAELRSGLTVHPTVRTIAQGMGQLLQLLHPKLPLFVNHEPSILSLHRGTQTILSRET